MRDSKRPSDARSGSAEETAGAADERVVGGLNSVAQTLARLSIVGWYVAISIAGGALLGWWLDGIASSRPLLLVVGVLLGVAVAMVGMVRMLSNTSKKK